MIRRALAAVALVSLGLVALVIGAPAAGAHAALSSTTPAAGSVVPTSPDEIVLDFNETVELSLGGVRIFDSDRQRVDEGAEAERSGNGRRVTLPVERDLGDGTYVVTWRVTSADSHPISGAFTFQVGEGAATGDGEALADDLLAADGGSDVASGLYAAVRALVFVGLAGLVGLWAFVLLVRPGALGIARLTRLLWASWAVLFVSTALSIGLQGVTASGLPLIDAVKPSVLSAVVDTRFGELAVARLVLLVVAVPVLVWGRPHQGASASRSRPPAWWPAAVGVLSGGLFLTVALAGHAGSGRWIPLAVSVDVVHLAAMCTWLGGLVALLAVILPRHDVDELRAVVPRFSTTAFTCVVILVVTGTVQSYRQVGSIEALTTTSYGRVLLIKLGLVVGLVGIAAFSRALVRRRYVASTPMPAGPGALVSGGDVDDRQELERSVAFEVMLGVAILVVTAFLVNIPPGVDALESGPFTAQLEATDDVRVDVTIDPADAGPVDLHVYVLDDAGIPRDVEDVTVSLTLPDDDIGPLEVPVEPAALGHYSAYGFDIPISGDWQLEVAVRVTDFEQVDTETMVPIG
jgi:copper transport protein